jgi:hypothetical protein
MLKFSKLYPKVQQALIYSWFSTGYVLLVEFEKPSVLQRILYIVQNAASTLPLSIHLDCARLVLNKVENLKRVRLNCLNGFELF